MGHCGLPHLVWSVRVPSLFLEEALNNEYGLYGRGLHGA